MPAGKLAFCFLEFTYELLAISLQSKHQFIIQSFNLCTGNSEHRVKSQERFNEVFNKYTDAQKKKKVKKKSAETQETIVVSVFSVFSIWKCHIDLT